MGSILRAGVDEEITGEKAFFDQVAAAAETHVETWRYTISRTHNRRQVTLETYEWSDLIDDADKVRMLIDLYICKSSCCCDWSFY